MVSTILPTVVIKRIRVVTLLLRGLPNKPEIRFTWSVINFCNLRKTWENFHDLQALVWCGFLNLTQKMKHSFLSYGKVMEKIPL